ncbi:MAG: hypothetical protein E7G49_07480 [Cutibacterium granulosum]|uniref:DNA-(Apurinic or apyrimidinic site) lyase / pyrimidine dimer DNA glycosylase n=2 Tax=Cutibacterium granulosum TaxID=33011 RepID=U1F9I8_9ACTN|nr:hypothetical protein [Cutibacterium granulosum]ERF55686.1 DNA-(apurinic or apyrimidinic site) lyase / pyrimidine dimer DNA glycosylase [Cutibacterium granulosum DSM 20700]ERF64602.1 DNA-(apurinic or apyrimidinic site) lyase / pyrimidine dimer DNA glycosylase [Cutibacterium granulosum TM11]MDU3768599.1 hypothetical protein [Cutibacterium granulosum]MDU3821039.1 hypothetical protein [Cutibacterium granulosum]MEA5656569.1 hypothetical protein [Cutibacterium granulosum]
MLAGGAAGTGRSDRTHPWLHPPPAAQPVPREHRSAGAVAAFLDGIHVEATSRGFSYGATRIDDVARLTDHIDVTRGQLDYELEHLRRKLARRSPERLEQLPTSEPTPHPLFRVIDGPIADWEVR